MLKSVTKFVERVLRDNMGTSIVELALIFPVFLLLVVGSIELASAFTVKLRTQQAAARTMELATYVNIEAISLDNLRAEAASGAKVPIANVSAQKWLECNRTKQPSFEGTCGLGQETARFVSVLIQNEYRLTLGHLLPASIAPNGSIAFTGYSSVRKQ